MNTVFKITDFIVTTGFDIFLFVLMFLSIKKCFWEEGRSKVSLFFMTVVVYPFQWFFISIVASFGIVGLIFLLFGNYNANDIKTLESFFFSRYYVFSGACLTIIVYLLAIALCSFIGILWLKFKNIAPFLFLNTMYITLLVTSVKAARDSLFGIPNLGYILDIVSSVFGYVAIWVFYRLVVSRFSELIKEKHEINWKLFIIPPLAFSIPYSSIALMMLLDFANDDVVFFSAFFSVVIVFLFIWAFYVIIKNMMATNEAIKAKDEIKTLSVEVMEALAHTIDAKDEYTKGHSVRVAKYSRMLAEKLGLSDEDCESVYYMALLHDIGKIGVPNEIINGKSQMTDEEYAVMKTHPVVGSNILSEIQSRPDLMIGARWHHERYDGKGYPDGKAGEDIPFFARIISVADSYDAMTSNRSYRKFLPQDVVRSEIEKNCGTQFDPNVAKCMLSIIDEDVNYEYHE